MSKVWRLQVGDVILLPGDKGAHVLLLRSDGIPKRLASSLKSVRSISVEVSELSLSEVHRRPASVKEMTVVEASARLDAVGEVFHECTLFLLLKIISQLREPSESVGQGWLSSSRAERSR